MLAATGRGRPPTFRQFDTKGKAHGPRPEARDHRLTQAQRHRHRFARGADRAAHRTHQPPHRALQDAQEGPPQPSWSAQAGRPSPPPARLRQEHRRGPLPRHRRRQRPAPLSDRPRQGPVRTDRPFFAPEGRWRSSVDRTGDAGSLVSTYQPSGTPGSVVSREHRTASPPGSPAGEWPAGSSVLTTGNRPPLHMPGADARGRKELVMADAIRVSTPVTGTDKTLSFETGKLAQQSMGAVVAS